MFSSHAVKFQENAIAEDTTSSTTFRKQFVTRVNARKNGNEVSTASFEYTQSNEDETEVLGRFWMLEYKKLQPDQQMLAKRAVNEILFQAALGTLQGHSVIIALTFCNNISNFNLLIDLPIALKRLTN